MSGNGRNPVDDLTCFRRNPFVYEDEDNQGRHQVAPRHDTVQWHPIAGGPPGLPRPSTPQGDRATGTRRSTSSTEWHPIPPLVATLVAAAIFLGGLAGVAATMWADRIRRWARHG